MAKGLALLVGLGKVDPTCYEGWDGTEGCAGCEVDVDKMYRILKPLKYEIVTRKTAEATHDNIMESLYDAAHRLTPDDILVFYYAGHGSQQPAVNNDETDGQDETLDVYDRKIVDNELEKVWVSAAKGARIVMISDSCNSGTNYRSVENPVYSIPSIAEMRRQVVPIRAQLIHFGSCQDGCSSSGYSGGGIFTSALCATWADGAFQGNYPQFYTIAASLIKSEQICQYNESESVTDSFRDSRPFQI